MRVMPSQNAGRPGGSGSRSASPGTWKNLPGTYRAKGRKAVRTQALGKGTYRVRVLAGNGIAGSTSRARRLIN